MSIFLMKMLWYPIDDISNPINITDIVDMRVGRGMEIKNNVLRFTLKNPPEVFVDSSTTQLHKYTDTLYNVKFKEQDQMKLWCTYTDDFSDYEDSTWSGTAVTEPDSAYLKGIYYVIDHSSQNSNTQNSIQVTCADKTYILFNRLFAKSFALSESRNAPEIIQKVIRYCSQNPKGIYSGTGSEINVKYDIDAKLEDAEGGYIQDIRKSVTENGSVNSDTTFPDIAIAKIWKPVYEWISELSQIENLNTNDELIGDNGKTIVYGRSFLYYVDENNIFHWFETDDTVSGTGTIVIGTTPGIYDYKLDKKVFDTVNFIVFRGGEDFYGKGTLDYEVDETSNVKTLKMRVIAMTDIAKRLIQKEISIGNLTPDTSGAFTFSGNRYDRNGTVTPHWSNTSYDNDTNYNNALRDQILSEGHNRARSLIKGLAHARYAGKLVRKGENRTVGDLLNVTNKRVGQNQELLRVMEVTDNIDKNGWVTTLDIEQDKKAIIESLEN